MIEKIKAMLWRLTLERRTRKAALEDGESRAKAGLPLWEPNLDQKGKPVLDEQGRPKYRFNEYEMELAHGYGTTVNGIVKRWGQVDAALLGRYRTAERQRRARQEEASALEAETETLRGQCAELAQQKAAFEPPPVEPKWWQGPVLLAFAVGEIPLNAIAFRPIREAEIMNYALALLLGCVLVFLAHVAGMKLKERRWGAVGLALIVPVATLAGIAYVRMGYVAGRESSMSSGGTFWVFWTFGAAVLAAAMAVSYLCHEGRDDVQTVQEDLKEKSRTLAAKERNLKHAKTGLQAAQHAVDALKGRRQAAYNAESGAIGELYTSLKLCIDQYRGHYLRAYYRHAPPDRPATPSEGPKGYPHGDFEKSVLWDRDPDKLDWSVPKG